MARGFGEFINSIFKGRQKGDILPIEITTTNDGAIVSIYSSNINSSILESVLASQPAGAHPGASPARHNRKGDSAASVAKKIGIGEALRVAKETVLAAGHELAARSGPPTADHVSKLLTTLESQLCHIAFIGQMNAGKSTLVNSFIGLPKLLPSEITPWTTVVTNLYFGIPKQPTSGAVFEFFNKSEWQQLAEGSVRVRALTEMLIPKFSWETFSEQVGSMHERAQEKFGARFETLLGQQHAYASVTPQLLEKYIAAESPLDDEREAGEYSMITKAAHIYFGLSSFFYPTVVIDTPGINDPFLVRDEITRQNLERANIFIIVITARQPLSDADVDLLRILRGLNKERIIIFVNKIDEFEDLDASSSAIVERIKGLLDREFPAARIPIVVGSAAWASAALSGDARELSDIACTLGLTAPGESPWLPNQTLKQALTEETILMRSGVPDLALAVSEMMRTGPIADCVRYTAQTSASIARNLAARAQMRAKLASDLIAVAEKMQGSQQESTGHRAAGLATIDRARHAVEAVIDETRNAFGNVSAASAETFRAGLTAELKSYLAALVNSSSGNLDAPSQHGQLSSVAPLRSALERELSRLFCDVKAQITALSRDSELALQHHLDSLNAALGLTLDYLPLPTLKSSPPLSALAEPVCLDAGGIIHAQWWRRTLSWPERSAHIAAVIGTQFAAIIEKLCVAAEAEIERITDFILNHFQVMALHTLQAIHDEHLAMVAGTNSNADDLKRRRQQDQLEAKTCTEIAQRLGDVLPG